MPYCQECGEEIDPESSFCNSCGAPIKAGESQKERKKASPQGKNSLDIDENIEGALTYVLTWLTGIIFFVIEDQSDFVRFHAMQSIITFLPLTILAWVINIFSVPYYGYGFGFSLFGILSTLIWIAVLVLWLLLMYKAYQGEKYKLPIVGDLAEDFLSS